MTITERVDHILKEIRGVASMYNVSSWEMTFLNTIRMHDTLTDKQEKVLTDIERKVFDDELDRLS